MGRGITTTGDLLAKTTDGVDLNSIWAEYQQTLDTVNKQRNIVSALFSFDTTKPVDAINLDTDSMNFEEHSEFGAPKAGRTTQRLFYTGYPLNWYDLRVSFTRDFLRDATRAEVDSRHADALAANNRLVFNATMRALTTKTGPGTRVANAEGNTVYSLYDGAADSEPPSFANRAFATGHDHYLVSGANTVDGQDLADMIKHITHHGYGIDGREKIVILMHPDLGEKVRGFRISANSPYDFIPSEGAPAYLSTESLVGDKPPINYQGLPIFGSYGNALLAESYLVPSGYLIAASTSGENSPRNALGFRSHARPEYAGLRMEPGTDRYPLVGSTYAQGFGVGVRNRGAAVVMQIKASGTYDNPSYPAF